MASGLAKILNIEKAEVSAVSILLFQSVFLGIFAGIFDVSAQSYFLEIFSADLIPKAFAYSGGVGIIITSVYSFFQSRIRFSVFAVFNLVFVALVTISLRLGFAYFDHDKLVFAMFVLMGPLTIVSFLGFWGTVSRMFTLRQGKRLFGLVDTGQIMGIILASYAIPILLRFNFEILNSLYICSGSILLALIVQVIISSRFKMKGVEADNTRKRSNFLDLFKRKYTLLMVGFVVLSVLAAFFIHYSFLFVTEENYPEPDALASFLGVFMGTVMVFTLILKTFLYARLMKTYGLKLALVISPVLLGIFVIGALIIGSVYGYSAASAGFTFFFLLMVSGKLFSKSFKDSVEVPSSKILYQSLDPAERFDVQSRIDGTVNELAAFSSGLLMAGLALISGFKLIHFSIVLVVILLLWIILAFRLHRSYRKSLRDSLKKYQESGGEVQRVDTILNMSNIEEKSGDELEGILEFCPQAWNGFISRNLHKLLDTPGKIREMTLDWIDRLNLDDSQDIIEKYKDQLDNPLKKQINQLLLRFRPGKKVLDDKNLSILIESSDPEDRLRALLAIDNEPGRPDNFQFLTLLMRDTDLRVRISAIRVAGRGKYTEFAGRIIDLLEDDVYYPFAFSALHAMGDTVLEKLDNAFNRSSASSLLMNRILNLIILLETGETIPVLVRKLEQPETSIHRKVLKRLGEMDYTPDETTHQRLSEYLHKIIGITSWNLTTRVSLKESDFSEELVKCFDREIVENYELIFDILSVMYDAQTIRQINLNIETGSTESIGYSLELLDLFVDENIKHGLFALLEDSSDNTKIAALQTEFPVEMLHGEDLLHSIINRDYNFLHTYSRVLALRELISISNYKPGDELVAHMFNPDIRVARVAAASLCILDREVFESVLDRLGEKRKEIFERLGREMQENMQLSYLFNVVSLLEGSELQNSLSIFDLYEFSTAFDFYHLGAGDEMSLSEYSRRKSLLYYKEGKLDLMAENGELVKNIQPATFQFVNSELEKDQKNLVLKAGSEVDIAIMKENRFRKMIFDDEKSYLPVIKHFMLHEPDN